MIEQTQQELADAMKENPMAWAGQYIDLLYTLDELADKHEKLSLALLPTNPKQH